MKQRNERLYVDMRKSMFYAVLKLCLVDAFVYTSKKFGCLFGV